MKNESELKYLIALSQFTKFGPVRMQKIKKFFSSLEKAWLADSGLLTKAGIEETVAREFIAARGKIDPEKLIDIMAKEKINAIAIEDEIYPKLLKEIFNPPQILYYKGRLKKGEDFNIGVVGSRKFSPYGRQAAEVISGELAKNGLTIVSGLALGIDSISHEAALSVKGKTIAVLGSSLERENIYPSLNRYLSDKIIDSGGAIISEFPLGTPPLKHNFPQRNRIISGVSLGTLVIEAGEKSGALITAHFALEQNREVFAIPGNIYSPNSAGTNALIKKGARAVTNASDIMESLNLNEVKSFIASKEIIPETPEEKVILENLSREPVHVNELIRTSKLDTKIINSTLTIMEMKGMVKNLGNMQYVLAR